MNNDNVYHIDDGLIGINCYFNSTIVDYCVLNKLSGEAVEGMMGVI